MDDDLIVIVVDNNLEPSDVSILANKNEEDIISQVLMLVNSPEAANHVMEIDSIDLEMSNTNDECDFKPLITDQENNVEDIHYIEDKGQFISEPVIKDSCADYFDINLLKQKFPAPKVEKICKAEIKNEPGTLNNHEMFEEIIEDFKLEQSIENEEEYITQDYEVHPIPPSNVEILKEPRRGSKAFVGNKSYVKDLIQQFPELMEDDQLLIEVVSRIMKEVKAPPLPEKYCVVKNEKYQCIFCNKRTDTLPAAGRHYQEKHGTRYLVCYACGVDFRSRTSLYKHEKKCTAPDIEIVLRARGIFLGRKGQNRPFLDHTRKFENFSGSSSHPYREICKNPHISQESTTDETGKYKKRIYKSEYHCNECPAVFTSKIVMESHINKHLGKRPYRCNKCPNAYADPCVFKRHLATHDNTEYICDICARSLKTKGSLIVHMNTHLPTKKFGCPECSKRYAQKYALKIHMNKVHMNLPHPFGCQICTKRFPLLSKLKDHMQRYHGLSIMTRNMFEKSLPKLSDEDVQMAKVLMTSYVTDQVPIPLAE